MVLTPWADRLEALYHRCNCRSWVHPDPVELIYAYDDPADREIAALVVSSLAYGRVGQILVSSRRVLERMTDRPRRWLADQSIRSLRGELAGFRHRFADADDLAGLLWGIRAVVQCWGSLEVCCAAGLSADEPTAQAGLAAMVGEIRSAGRLDSHLLACPTRSSACKRLWLYLRWMVRSDAVDPGGWERIGPERLVVPVDVHMHRIATRLGATRRRSADRRTAMEITDAFRRIRPDDPVRYDFALTRLGIHPDAKAAGWELLSPAEN